MKTVDFTGTVTSLTMRVQDVLPALMDVLVKYYPEAYKVVTSAISIELDTGYTEICNDHDDPAWDTEIISWITHEIAWDAMEEIAPEGYYFGAHAGDGCDYGFWKIKDWIDDEPCCHFCGRYDLTLLTCPVCDELLCQNCLDTDAHVCEPE